jgi:hypothetical protein
MKEIISRSPTVFCALAETGLEEGVIQDTWHFAGVRSKISSPWSLNLTHHCDSEIPNFSHKKNSNTTVII